MPWRPGREGDVRGDPQPPLHAKDRLCLTINHIILQLLSLSMWILLVLYRNSIRATSVLALAWAGIDATAWF